LRRIEDLDTASQDSSSTGRQLKLIRESSLAGSGDNDKGSAAPPPPQLETVVDSATENRGAVLATMRFYESHSREQEITTWSRAMLENVNGFKIHFV
jgi:hypothetical protein